MSAFVPSTTPFPTRGGTRTAVCQTRPTTSPFFGSGAFGMPVARAPAPARSQLRMDVTIVVGDNEPVESALRRFKKDVTRSGHLFELRRRRYFETNTERRLRKAAASRRKAKMARNAGNRSFNMS